MVAPDTMVKSFAQSGVNSTLGFGTAESLFELEPLVILQSSRLPVWEQMHGRKNHASQLPPAGGR